MIEILNIAQVVIYWLQGGTNFATLLLNLIIPAVVLIYFLADHNVRTVFGR